MKFTVDRNRWIRGNGLENSVDATMYNNDCYCALGFYAHDAGIPDYMLNCSSPDLIENVKQNVKMQFLFRDYPEGMLQIDTPLCHPEVYDILVINDIALGKSYKHHTVNSEEERELLIKEKFDCLGINVEFV